MRRKVHKRSRAESDLIGIWEYTAGEWGEAQADKYLDELDKAIHLLVDNPEMGAPRDHVRSGYRVLFVSSHAIYYTVTPSSIHIIRILHGKMDPDRHL